MLKAKKLVILASFLIFFLFVFYSPCFLIAQAEGKGNLSGIVYGKDGSTPLAGAGVEIRETNTSAVYEATTDRLGTFRIEGINAGLYLLGVNTEEANLKLRTLVQVKAGGTARLSVALSGDKLIERITEAKPIGKGELIGIIYAEDSTTPIEGAVVKIRNLYTSVVYEAKTDMLGTFQIKGIDEGLYAVGVSTAERDFNLENLVGIKAGEKTVLSLALTSKAWLVDLKPKVKPSGLVKFFTSPAGIATVIGSTAAIGYGIVKLTEKEEEVSPFK